MVFGFTSTPILALKYYPDIDPFILIIELANLTILYRIDQDRVIPISTDTSALDIFNTSTFKLNNCQISLTQRRGTVDVEIEWFRCNLNGYSEHSKMSYANVEIKRYQIRTFKHDNCH